MSIRQFHSQNKTLASSPSPIGGTPLYIIAGQSNCGRSRVSEMTAGQQTAYASPLSNAKMFNAYRYYQNSVSTFETLDAGSNTMLENANYTDEFGMETSLAHQLEAYLSKPRYYIKMATGNTSLAVDWDVPSGFRYSQLKTVINNALDDAGLPSDIRLHAFIWMQGENDAFDPYADAYLTNLQDFFNDFSNWWVNTKGKNGDFKKVIGRIQSIGAGDPGGETKVRTAQLNYCSNPANNAIMIDTDAYTRLDYIHYDATSQIQFGIDIFNLVKGL